MKATRTYKSGFVNTLDLDNLHSNFADLSDLSNVHYSNLRTASLRQDIVSSITGLGGETLDNQLYTNIDGKITASQIQDIYKLSGSKLDFQDWLKTESAKGAIAYETYRKSGSKQTIGEWLQSDSGKQMLTNATLLTALALGNNTSGNPNTNTGTNQTEVPKPKAETETKIAGMSPITFSILSVLALTGIYFGIKAKAKK